jgi:tocopherol O-methyltransferase
MGKDDVIYFYRKSWSVIVKLLCVDKTYCIHHGYYEKGIRTHVQSVLNMNDYIGRLLKLETKGNQTKQVLDAGCGIGGTVIYLAKKYPNVKFQGITIVPDHIKIAKNLAKQKQIARNTDFILADFIKTGFPANQFDAIYLIESASYAQKKQMLIQEMHRILKPGGTLVIVDCFRTAVLFNQLLNRFYIWFCKAWGLPNLISIEECEDILKTRGFQNITTKDLTKNVMRTILRCDILGIPYLFSILFRRMIQGKHYKIEEDPAFLAAASFCSSIIGLAKGITYNAVTAMK